MRGALLLDKWGMVLMIEFEDEDLLLADVNSSAVSINVGNNATYIEIYRCELIKICQKMGVTVSELLDVE